MNSVLEYLTGPSKKHIRMAILAGISRGRTSHLISLFIAGPVPISAVRKLHCLIQLKVTGPSRAADRRFLL
jgi:hypothetical protein